MWVIVLTPKQGRSYGGPEVLGTFPDEALAEDHLENLIDVDPDFDGWVVPVDNVSTDDGSWGADA